MDLGTPFRTIKISNTKLKQTLVNAIFTGCPIQFKGNRHFSFFSPDIGQTGGGVPALKMKIDGLFCLVECIFAY